MLVYLAKDPVLAVFKQVIETTASLLSVLWTNETEQCHLSTPLLRTFVERIQTSRPSAPSGKLTREVATRGLMFFASECDFIGPVQVTHMLHSTIRRLMASRSRASVLEHLLKPFMLIINTFGCRHDPNLPPEDQHLTIRGLAKFVIELVKNRHESVSKIGLDLAIKMYTIDLTMDACASRDALQIHGDVAAMKQFRTREFAQRMIDVDRKLRRKVYDIDLRIAEGRGGGRNDDDEEEDDENVRALKSQLAEMKAMMKKVQGGGGGSGKNKKGIKKKRQTPHPPQTTEDNEKKKKREKQQEKEKDKEEAKQREEEQTRKMMKKKEEKETEEKKQEEKEKQRKENEKKRKEEKMEKMEKMKKVRNEAKNKKKEPAVTPPENQPAKQGTGLDKKEEEEKIDTPSPALMKKKMVIMKQIRDLKFSKMAMEAEEEKKKSMTRL